MFKPNGRIDEFVGGFEDWLRQGGAVTQLVEEAQTVKPAAKKSVAPKPASVQAAPAKKKLSYNLQRELDALPAEIETLETELAALEAQSAEASFYTGDQAMVQQVLARLTQLNQLIEQKMERWNELDSM